MAKLLITEDQFQSLGKKGLITEVNLQDIVHRTEKYILPQYQDFINSQGLSNTTDSVALFLSKNGNDTNWRVKLLKDLAQAED